MINLLHKISRHTRTKHTQYEQSRHDSKNVRRWGWWVVKTGNQVDSGMHELMLKVLRPRLTRLPFSPVVASPQVGVGRAAENDRSRTLGNVPRFRTKYVLKETWLIASAKPEASSEGGVSFVRRSHSENEYFPLLSAASVLRTPPFRLGKSTCFSKVADVRDKVRHKANAVGVALVFAVMFGVVL